MANTEHIEAKLAAYVEGQLDPADRAEIEQHLAANPQHQQLLQELREIRAVVKEIPAENAPPEIMERLHQQLERTMLLGEKREEPVIAGRINPWPSIVTLAAMIMLAIGLGAIVFFSLPSHHAPPVLETAMKSDAKPISDSRLGTTAEKAKVAGEADGDIAAKTADLGAGKEALAMKGADEKDRSVFATPAAISAKDALPVGAIEQKLGENEKLAQVQTEGATAKEAGAMKASKSMPPETTATGTRDAFASAQTQNNQAEQLQNALQENARQDRPGTVANVAMNAPGGGGGMKSAAVGGRAISNEINAATQNAFSYVYVTADNPTDANSQINQFLSTNGYRWEPLQEPMPPAIQNQGGESFARMVQTTKQLKLNSGFKDEPTQTTPAGAAFANAGEMLQTQNQLLVPNITRSKVLELSRTLNFDNSASNGSNNRGSLRAQMIEAVLPPAPAPTTQVARRASEQQISEPPTSQPVASRFAPGDQIEVSVDELVGPGLTPKSTVKVADDGTIQLPMIAPLRAAGATEQDLRERIATQYQQSNLLPKATVSLRSISSINQPAQQVIAVPTTQNVLFESHGQPAPSGGALTGGAMAGVAPAGVAQATTQPQVAPADSDKVDLVIIIQSPSTQPAGPATAPSTPATPAVTPAAPATPVAPAPVPAPPGVQEQPH